MLIGSFASHGWACLAVYVAALRHLHIALIKHEDSVLQLLVSRMLLLLGAETEVILLQCFTERVTALQGHICYSSDPWCMAMSKGSASRAVAGGQ